QPDSQVAARRPPAESACFGAIPGQSCSAVNTSPLLVIRPGKQCTSEQTNALPPLLLAFALLFLAPLFLGEDADQAAERIARFVLTRRGLLLLRPGRLLTDGLLARRLALRAGLLR